MITHHVIFLFMIMLVVAIMVEPLAKLLRLPFTAVLVVTGFIISECLVMAGVDTGLRWDNFHNIIFYALIPILVFESACKMSLSSLIKNSLPILMLAIPFLLISVGIIATILYFGVDHPTGFPWIAAILVGVLLSATDPAAVISMLKDNQAPERLGLVLEGESLFNDATAIVLFSIVLSLAMIGGEVNMSSASLHFLAIFMGGLAIGVVIGMLARFFAQLIDKAKITSVITIISAYLSFLIAEDFFHLSGVMSVLACGIVFGENLRRQSDQEDQIAAKQFVMSHLDVLAYIATAILFLLAGFTITLEMFSTHWLAIVIGVLAITLARIVIIFGLLPAVSLLPSTPGFSYGQQIILSFGGVRGAVTLALALSLPIELDYWYTVQSIAYGVVLFTLFIQTPLLPLVIKKYS